MRSLLRRKDFERWESVCAYSAVPSSSCLSFALTSAISCSISWRLLKGEIQNGRCQNGAGHHITVDNGRGMEQMYQGKQKSQERPRDSLPTWYTEWFSRNLTILKFSYHLCTSCSWPGSTRASENRRHAKRPPHSVRSNHDRIETWAWVFVLSFVNLRPNKLASLSINLQFVNIVSYFS